jgi:hypothetical protein
LPSQNRCITRITHVNLEENCNDREARDIQPLRTGNEQSDCRSHRSEIRTEVDHMGDEEETDESVEYR